ncbi:MAG: response regulator transcription factor [Acidobacteria bacterium]|nr:response regulator transcription factor [Acidobacteriota bacterium]
MTKENPIRILVADDHPVVADGLAAMIERQPDMTVVATATTGLQAVDLFQAHRPDVTLMDLRMPGMSGLDAIIAIRKDVADARILVLTTYDGDEDIHRAIDAGARGYLLKDARREELLDAIRDVHSGRSHIPAPVAARLRESGPRIRLSPRELEVLRLMAKGSSNKDIAQALHITEGTVKGYVVNILTKLDVRDRTEAVTVALQRGVFQL